MSKAAHIVLGVTGSIAAYKAADIIRQLKSKGFRVSVIMTRCATRFITPLTLASLSGEPVHQDMFVEPDNPGQMTHIHMAKEADVLLIAPATADFIGKMACGLADDLLACTALASEAPLIVAPAMNDRMYAHPAVVENCGKLKERGAQWIEPEEGELACGTYGAGRLARVERIVEAVEKTVH